MEIHEILEPGEGNEHRAQDIVEDAVTVGTEEYKTTEPVGKLSKLRKKVRFLCWNFCDVVTESTCS